MSDPEETVSRSRFDAVRSLHERAEARERALYVQLLRIAKACGVKVEYLWHTDPAVDTDTIIASINQYKDELEACYERTDTLMEALGVDDVDDVLPRVKALVANSG
jgi:hypothetical protein